MSPFNVGVIGIGDISDVYINNLKTYDVVKVVACAGRDLEKARRKADAHGLRKAYATPQALVSDPEIDIVLNLTLPGVHAELTMMALEAGKHVYTEKPLAATFQEGRQVLDFAKGRGLTVCCAPDTFLGGRLQTCRKLIDDGSIGEVTAASAFVVSHGHEWFHTSPDFFYKRGAGPLLDIGPYYVTALVSLLGSAKRCAAMSKRTFGRRIVESEPNKGKAIDVEVDTHVTGSIEFASGAIATLIASFDVWDSELPRMEIYGTKGTICIRDIDPVDGPNLFGGKVLVRDVDSYRWKGLPRREPFPDWSEIPIEHRFNDLSHRRNSRGIGLVDMAYALTAKREARASGVMGLHCLEVMEGLLTSASEQRFYDFQSRCERPAPLPENFPEGERALTLLDAQQQAGEWA
jgi:predicted dehydrogenase